MAKVRRALYNNPFGSWPDFLISGYTWLFNWFTKPYSHVEIGFFIDGKWQYFSSSIRDGGTRWKDGDELLKNKGNWDVAEAEYGDAHVDRMIARARLLEGKKYDILGIFGYVTFTGLILNAKEAWYCSEAWWYIFAGFWKKIISPRRLSKRTDRVFKKVEI